MIVAQPILAGAYLQDEFDALGLHSTDGSTLAAVFLLQIGVAFGYWLVGRGSFVPVLVSVVMFFAAALQIAMCGRVDRLRRFGRRERPDR